MVEGDVCGLCFVNGYVDGVNGSEFVFWVAALCIYGVVSI